VPPAEIASLLHLGVLLVLFMVAAMLLRALTDRLLGRHLPRRRHATHEQRRYIYRRDHHRCVYCRTKVAPNEFQSDHVVPFSRGGQTKAANLVVACKLCNAAKGTMSAPEFRRRLAEEGLRWRDETAWRRQPWLRPARW
jgi:5-methylcytosine-specific restriction endonuclease McrA